MNGRKPHSPFPAAACAALAFVAAACNRDSATTGPSHILGKDFAANLRLVAGDQQAGPLGAPLALPIRVKVVDAGGQPVQGATVTFSVRAGGGSMNPAANVSDGAGIVSSVWTMGTSLGAAKVVAILTNAFVLDSTTFTATATVGPPRNFTKVSGDNQTINASRQLAAPLVVQLQDAYGNNVSGTRITWTPAAGSVSFVADTTAANGSASANWTLGTAATTQSLTASVPGLSALSFTAIATPDTGRIFTVSSAPPAAGAVSAVLGTVTAKVTDQHNNVVSGAAITWNDSLSVGSTLSATSGTTSAAGTASTTWTLGRRAGAQVLRAKLTGRAETITVNANATIAFSDVFAGNFMACGIVAANNNIYCWGAGSDGQLGQGTFAGTNAASDLVPQSGSPLAGVPLQARQLTGGRNGFCALTVARTLYCWGRQFGAAGVASPVSVTLATGAGSPILPNAVFMGEDFGCLVSLAGDPFCTGNGINGQLGNGAVAGTAIGTWAAVTPPDGALTFFASIGVGRTHGCGVPRFINAALGAISQLVYCWGLNIAGQLGDGTTTRSLVPKAVEIQQRLPAIRLDSASLSVGATHACVLEALSSTTPGRAWCWGGNGFGQLGTNSTVDSPVLVPVSPPVGGSELKFIRIFAGEYHTCGIVGTPGAALPGPAYCWGRNDYGQLGNGQVTIPLTVPAAVSGLSGFRSLSLGELFTCGVTASTLLISNSPSQLPGTAYCWGDNLFGQLGTNTNSQVLNPSAGKVSFQP